MATAAQKRDRAKRTRQQQKINRENNRAARANPPALVEGRHLGESPNGAALGQAGRRPRLTFPPAASVSAGRTSNS